MGKNLGERITVWAPFNMPWSFTYMGYGVGAFPPGRENFSDFLKAAHTVTLSQAQALRSIKAVSAKATGGSAYGMSPSYPKTGSTSDHAAARRDPAIDTLRFLQAAMRGRYPISLAAGRPSEP